MSKTKEDLVCRVFLNKNARKKYLDWLIQNKVSPQVAVLLVDCEIGDIIKIEKKGFFNRFTSNISNEVSFPKFKVTLDATNIDVEFLNKHCEYKHYNEVYSLLGALDS